MDLNSKHKFSLSLWGKKKNKKERVHPKNSIVYERKMKRCNSPYQTSKFQGRDGMGINA